MFGWFPIFDYLFYFAGLVSIVTYLFPVLLQVCVFDVLEMTPLKNDLKKKYGAEWALVTGASSGIGKAIVEKLCGQGINVVLVALDDKLLAATFAEMQERFPNLQFRKLGCDLSKGPYLEEIQEGTKDLNIQLIFNNAGFITVGMLHKTALGRNLANFECNATASIKLTHHFVNKLTADKQKGLIAYTSSSASFVPNPLSSLYASTKSFMTLFATSVAGEVHSMGIDVVVVHPSPMDTNFFNEAGSMGVLMFFKKHFAAPPSKIADVIFSSAGRFVVRDQGAITIIFRMILKFLDFNFFCDIVARTSHMSDDYNKDHSGKKKT
jgi:short-subunit dehydrogenase